MTDDELDPLRTRLRAADPAAGLDPPPDRWIAELTEAVMSTAPHPGPLRPPAAAPGPSRRWLVPAAAATVLAVVGVGAIVLGPGDGPTPSAGPATTSSSPSSSPSPSSGGSGSPAEVPLVLTSGRLQAGRCLPVSAATLGQMPTALEGVVTSVDGRDATLRVVRWWLGTTEQRASDAVVVRGMTPQLTELVAGVVLEPGGRYLVTATDRGDVTACGLSAAWSPRLERLYADAFGG